MEKRTFISSSTRPGQGMPVRSNEKKDRGSGTPLPCSCLCSCSRLISATLPYHAMPCHAIHVYTSCRAMYGARTPRRSTTLLCAPPPPSCGFPCSPNQPARQQEPTKKENHVGSELECMIFFAAQCRSRRYVPVPINQPSESTPPPLHINPFARPCCPWTPA